jgi:DNA recombination protein RmuC
MGKLGKSLENAVESYNNTVGSLETRVLVSARRFKELQSEVQGVEIPALPQVDRRPRNLQAPEFSAGSAETSAPKDQ